MKSGTFKVPTFNDIQSISGLRWWEVEEVEEEEEEEAEGEGEEEGWGWPWWGEAAAGSLGETGPPQDCKKKPKKT